MPEIILKVGAYGLLAYLILLTKPVFANDLSWHVWQENSDLSVVYRPSQFHDSIEIKAQARLNSSLAGFIYFLEDLDNLPNWLDNADSAVMINQISANENVFVTRFKGIWPISARDMVVHTHYWQNDDLSIEIAVTDASELIAKNKNSVRMKVLSAHWTIIPTSPNQLAITYQFSVDPKGNLPQWLIKPMTLKGIWATLENLQAQLPDSTWQAQTKNNIEELSHN